MKKKGQERYISRVRGSGTPIGGMMKLGTFVDVPDVMNLANFHIHVMNILRAGIGSKMAFSLCIAYGSYNIAFALPRWQVITSRSNKSNNVNMKDDYTQLT
jgi:hypothetical protein